MDENELSITHGATTANFTAEESQEILNVLNRPDVREYLSTGSEYAQNVWAKFEELQMIEEQTPSNVKS